MIAIPFVFTIARAVEMLDDEETWLHELSIRNVPEDGLCVLDTGER